MDTILSPDWKFEAWVSLILGVSVSQLLQVLPFEIDRHAYLVLPIYLGAASILLLILWIEPKAGLVTCLSRSGLAITFFNAGLFGYMLLCRAFFHKLRKFPGPWPAKLSKFYWTYQVLRDPISHLRVEKLHQELGDFVRTGPRELSINRPSAVNILHGPASKCHRSTWYDTYGGDDKSPILLVRDLELHKQRKKAWDRGLGPRALDTYEPRLVAKADLLMDRLALVADKPVNVTELSMFYVFDVMGEVGYSSDFEMLKTGKEHPAVGQLHDTMWAFGLLSTVPWLTNILLHVPRASELGGDSDFSQWCWRRIEARRKMLQCQKAGTHDEEAPQDVASWLLKTDDGETWRTDERALMEDSKLLVVAGSDTASAALTNALYYLAKNKSCYRTLQRHLDHAFPGGYKEWNITTLKNFASRVPYLDWILQETLRLKPPVPQGVLRLTPPEGVQIDEVFIPGDVIVAVPTYTIHRDERYWGKNAREFVPERWENLSTDRVPWVPFTRGRFSCPGKSLAMMELRIAISRIALQYDLEFVCEEDGDKFDQGAKDMFTLFLPALNISFKSR